MVRMTDVYEGMRPYLEDLDCITFASTPWVGDGRPLAERRIAIVSTAGLQRRGDLPFAADAADYRVLPGDSTAANVVMSHVSVEYDRTGFQLDLNVVFPIDCGNSPPRALLARWLISTIRSWARPHPMRWSRQPTNSRACSRPTPSTACCWCLSDPSVRTP